MNIFNKLYYCLISQKNNVKIHTDKDEILNKLIYNIKNHNSLDEKDIEFIQILEKQDYLKIIEIINKNNIIINVLIDEMEEKNNLKQDINKISNTSSS